MYNLSVSFTFNLNSHCGWENSSGKLKLLRILFQLVMNITQVKFRFNLKAKYNKFNYIQFTGSCRFY